MALLKLYVEYIVCSKYFLKIIDNFIITLRKRGECWQQLYSKQMQLLVKYKIANYVFYL